MGSLIKGTGLALESAVFIDVSGGQASARTLAPLATPFFHRVMVLLAGHVDMPSW